MISKGTFFGALYIGPLKVSLWRFQEHVFVRLSLVYVPDTFMFIMLYFLLIAGDSKRSYTRQDVQKLFNRKYSAVFSTYLSRGLFKPRLIFARINGPNVADGLLVEDLRMDQS